MNPTEPQPNAVMKDQATNGVNNHDDATNGASHDDSTNAAHEPSERTPADLMKLAVHEGCNGVRCGEGGPFGAVIARGAEIVSRGHNRVLQTNDPTAHAEVVAIRDACARLGRFSLHDCELYSSCEPCPMCLSAIHWAKLPRVFFAARAADAAAVGFDDQFLYDLLRGNDVVQKCDVRRMECAEQLRPFQVYTEELAKNRSGRY